MKCLSLRQPFAELLSSGRKTIELRPWNTKSRGRFLIHASKGPNWESRFTEELGQGLPKGCIVGAATIYDVKKYSNKDEFLADWNKHLSDMSFAEKVYGFMIRDARRIKPFPLKGKLNFFEVDFDEPAESRTPISSV